MAGEWREVRLADLCQEVRYGYTASATDEPTGTRFLRVTDIANGSVNWNQVPFCEIRDEDFDRYRLRPGDIVIARMGSIGHAALITEPVRAVAASYLVVHRVNPGVADAGFVFYAVRSPMWWDFVWLHGSSGAVQPNMNARVMGEFRFRLPPLPEQRAIAHILGTLDDKIELNRRMSETLEAMARALFKSWFVDFDPVRAKMDGRWRHGELLPDLPAHLYDLFPDRLIDSELGQIPEGWEVKPFADTVEIIGGGTPKTSVAEYWNGRIPWFSVVDAPAEHQVWVIDTEKKITRAGVDSSSTRILSLGTTIISARGTVGRVALVGRSCQEVCK